jgi:hypothetical protein
MTREGSLREIDSEIHAIGKKFNLSRMLRPKNVFEELDAFIGFRGAYDPVFSYDFPAAAKLETLS